MPKLPSHAPPKGGKSRRGGTRVRWDQLQNQTPADLKDRERVLDEIFRVVLEFSEDLRLPPERATRIFAHARQTFEAKPYRLGDAQYFKELVRLGDVLTAWYTEPEYLDTRGVPAALPLAGKKSAASLISRFVPDVPADAVAQWLLAEGVLRKKRNHLVVPTRRMITFPQANTMMLDRIPFLLQALLRTFIHNLQAKSKGGDTHCEHMLAIDEFPLSEVPRFDWEVKRLVPMLLDQLEAWAAPYVQSKLSGGGQRARVGVEVFSYVEKDERPVKRRRPL